MPVFILDKKQKVSKDGKAISVGFRELTYRQYQAIVSERDALKSRIAKMDAAVLEANKEELQSALNSVKSFCDRQSIK